VNQGKEDSITSGALDYVCPYAKIHIRHILISGKFRILKNTFPPEMPDKIFYSNSIRLPSHSSRSQLLRFMLLVVLFPVTSSVIPSVIPSCSSSCFCSWLTVYKRRFTRRFQFHGISVHRDVCHSYSLLWYLLFHVRQGKIL
jgi:hypothetical protein